VFIGAAHQHQHPPPHTHTHTYTNPNTDDFWVRLSCGKDGRVVVEAQGQLRLGVGDWGVNPRRNAELLAALRAAAAGGKLPPGTCGAPGEIFTLGVK